MQFVPEEGVYVYFRYDEDRTIMVAFNSSSNEKPMKLARFAERLGNASTLYDPLENIQVPLPSVLQLGPKSAVLFEVR